jgi:signal transduction histidine kinase
MLGEWMWLIVGMVVGMMLTVPAGVIILRRGQLRAREAERRARGSERMAEIGAMTSGLAHEIKNPLSTIGLNAQLLQESIHESASLPEDERERLERRVGALHREVDRLRGILTDFLQFAGRIKLAPARHDLAQVVDTLADFFHAQSDQAGVILRTQLPEAPVWVDIDESLFKQALLNLMINATQAMSPPEAQPGPHAAPSHERRGDLILRVESHDGVARVHVIDTGPGIEPDRLSEIFQPYVSSKRGGTGLGLPTSRRIIEEHGGDLRAVSTPGRGSDFTIEVPLAGEHAAASGR